MKTVAVLANTILAVLACGIVVTEGLPSRPHYVAFTLLMLLVPVVAVFALARRGPADRPAVRAAAAVGCVAFAATVAWALVAQYPYPEGPAVVPFGVLALLAPIAALAALRRAAPLARAPRS
jgi:apolipoprotein N-acyltransferase